METKSADMKPVYLDHNATSPLRPKVALLWRELSAAGLGNPSSLHSSGQRARAVIDNAREQVAKALGVFEDEIIFTSGGTESNNLALQGLPGEAAILTTPIEHAAVLESAVIGKTDAEGLVKSKAFVVLGEGQQTSADELKDFVKERLAPYKYPRFIEFVDELPKTATGKIQRFRLRERETGDTGC